MFERFENKGKRSRETPLSNTVYSVWDNDDQVYKYYVGPDAGPSKVPSGPNPDLGTPADQAGVALPFGVRFVGTGDEAVGRVARAGINFSQMLKFVIYGLAAYGAWKLIGKSS